MADQVAFHGNDPERYVARIRTAQYMLTPGSDPAGGVIQKVSRTIADDRRAARFWARLMGMPYAEARPLLTSQHFVAGFVVGALEVWEAVKDDLGDDAD